MIKEDLLSKCITCLRFPLTVGVVFIHFNLVNGFNLSGIEYGLNNPKSYYYLITFFSSVLPQIAVPLFFLISGFLFFYHIDFGYAAYKKKLMARLRTLLVPYILWNIIAALWLCIRILPCLAWLFSGAQKATLDFSLSAIMNTFWNGYEAIYVYPNENVIDEISNGIFPMDNPLWYVRDLIIMVICTPVLYYVIKKMGYYFVIILGLFWYIAEPFNWGHLYQLITASFFFSWGAYYSINRKNFVAVFQKMSFVPLLYVLVAVIDVLTKKEEYNYYIHMAGILIGILAAVIIVGYLVEKCRFKGNKFLANASFFIFAFHYIFMKDLGKIIFKLMHQPESPCFWFFFYFFVPITTICICLGTYKIIKKLFPKMGEVLTGGR